MRRYFHSSVLSQQGGSSGSGPVGGGSRTWFSENIPAYVTPSPTGSGVYRDVASFTQWQSARAAAGPGDVIRITAPITGVNENNAVLSWRGTHPKGTAANPITITCTNGAYIQQTLFNNFQAGIDFVDCDHVHSVGMDIRGGVFGMRYHRSRGSVGSPIRIWHCTISGQEDAVVQIADAQSGVPSEYVSVRYCDLGDSTGGSDFNEGVYIGTGANAYFWQDRTHDVEVAYNHIHDVRGDGVDIKLGTYNINVHHNLIHDIGAAWGAGITSGPSTGFPGANPNPGTNPNLQLHDNWIYNIGYRFASPNASSYGIIANHAGTEVYNNVIWNLDPSNSLNGIRTILYLDDANFPINVYNNTIWASSSALVNAVSGGSGPTVSHWNNITGDGTVSSSLVNAADFLGPLPALNAGPGSGNETADGGSGAGSGFVLAATSNEINAATGVVPTVDITNVSRPQGAASDRGAYEHIP